MSQPRTKTVPSQTTMATISIPWFEHYRKPLVLGVQATRPRLSWHVENAPEHFKQEAYQVELTTANSGLAEQEIKTVTCSASESRLNPWPFDAPLASRQRVSVRVRVYDSTRSGPWSGPVHLEVGLLNRDDWKCSRIAAPWTRDVERPGPELMFRKRFQVDEPASQARLYITAQGVYEAELNGHRVGDHFMAPGWTTYDNRLQYQCYDVTELIAKGQNCLGARVAEGWFSGRLGWEGGKRNIWGSQLSLLAQLEIFHGDGRVTTILSDGSWEVREGPIQLAEIYDGEKYDARLEDQQWTQLPGKVLAAEWTSVAVFEPLDASVELTTGFSEPVRRIQTVKPVNVATSPSGKVIVDFGQNLVGYVRLSNIKGRCGHGITLKHAEVLQNGELETRPLRVCQATDEYILKGSEEGEAFEPRFTFHGFRYCQLDGWTVNLDDIEAVVCHTDMRPAGSFECSDDLVNKLYSNICWGMRGNFLSVPTDCPQRDERLGWSGDLSMFAPTATMIYDCFGTLKNWLVDARYDQTVLDGVPSMVTPNSLLADPKWLRRVPCAIWHDVVVILPWSLYEETGDVQILEESFESMLAWINIVPHPKTGRTHLWDPAVYQLAVSPRLAIDSDLTISANLL